MRGNRDPGWFSMLDPNHLRTLQVCARAGSFAEAAKILSYTPSAVSQHIAALEHATGAVLVERLPRGIRLTTAGSALAAHADVILGALADAETEVQALGRRGAGLRFGSFPTATICFGSTIVRRFRSRYPESELLYADVEPYEALAELRERKLDLALVFTFDRSPAGVSYEGVPVCADHAVDYVDLFDDDFFLVIPRGHSLAESPTVRLEQLADELILGHWQPWAPDLRHLCAAAGFDPRFDLGHRFRDFTASQALVAAGEGLTLVPALGLAHVRDDLVVRPLEPAPVRHVKAAVPKGSYRSAPARGMLEILHAIASDYAAPAPRQAGPVEPAEATRLA